MIKETAARELDLVAISDNFHLHSRGLSSKLFTSQRAVLDLILIPGRILRMREMVLSRVDYL